MVGNDRVEMVVENDIHRFDMYRVAVALENIINAIGRIIFPSVDFAMIARFVKTMRMQYVKLVDVFLIVDDMVVSMPAGRRVKIADH